MPVGGRLTPFPERRGVGVAETVDDPLLGKRPPQVKNTVIFAPTETADEAHYFCALLNSSPLNYLATYSSVRGGKSFGSGGFFERVRISKFRPGDAAHGALADASRQAHLAVAAADPASLAKAVAEIDIAAGTYWGLSSSELADMRTLIGHLRSSASEDATEDEDLDDA